MFGNLRQICGLGERHIHRPMIESPGFPGFFKFGTPPAEIGSHSGTDPLHNETQTGDTMMTAINTNQNLFAAVFALGISAVLFANAIIIPASPSLVA